jgi:HEAT repeat protein
MTDEKHNTEIREKRLSRSFRSQISADPVLSVAKLYSQPDDRDVCESLVRALEAPEKFIRSAAVNGLISLNDMYASTSVLWTLLHGSVQARKAAAEVLGKIGYGDILVIEYLIKALQDTDRIVRNTAIKALVLNSLMSNECQKNAIELLLYFRKDEKKYVRIAASKALRTIETILGVTIEPVIDEPPDTGKLLIDSQSATEKK